MKCIKAIIRPEKEDAVVRGLEAVSIVAMTRWDVLGRGRQRGIQIGGSTYGELPKVCIMLIVDNAQVSLAVETIMERAKTGNPGDGRIFVSAVQEAHTIRTGKAEKATESRVKRCD